MVEDVAECGTVVEDGAECGNRATVNIIVIVHQHPPKTLITVLGPLGGLALIYRFQ